MKFIIPLFLFFGITTANGQRFVNVGKENLDSLFLDDLYYWQVFALQHISGYEQPIIEISNESGKIWKQKETNSKVANKFLKEIITKVNIVPIYSLNDERFERYDTVFDLRTAEFLCFSENTKLKNKVGFGYYKYNDSEEKVSSHIFFLDYNNLRFLKDNRRIHFLDLLSSNLPKSKGDSIVNIKINNAITSLHLFDLSIISSDSSSVLNSVTEQVLRSYEVDFANIYYSGRDSLYTPSDDEWGNITVAARKPQEYLVPVWDEEGNQSLKRTIPYSMGINFIRLYFDKQEENKSKRNVYSNICQNMYTIIGSYLGSLSTYYINTSTLSKSSKKNEFLFKYLYEIYN
jgi:hypothetical protein